MTGIAPIAAIAPIGPLTSGTAVTGGAPTGAASFASVLGQGLDAVSTAQSAADSLAVQAAQGTLTDPAQYTIAASQAQLMTQLATTIESKAVAAFNTIMGMQA